MFKARCFPTLKKKKKKGKGVGVFPKSRIRSNYPYKKRILTIKREALVPFILISKISSLEKMLNFCLLAPDVS